MLQGFKRIMVWSVGTDVLVLVISFAVPYSDDCFVYAVMRSTDKSISYYNVREIQDEIGSSFRNALPFFYAFTGCNIVSSIFNLGKSKCWQSDERKEEITSIFTELGN